MQKTDSLELTLMLGKTEGRKRREWQRMSLAQTHVHHRLDGHESEQAPGVGWHYRFSGHELGQTPVDREGQGGLVCPWGGRESDTTWGLNNNNNIH